MIQQNIVEDQHPLKQGLKRLEIYASDIDADGRRPTSTKTRIETQHLPIFASPVYRRRPTSTKTRIETKFPDEHYFCNFWSKTNIH